MNLAGISPAEIQAAAGWERGADGKWRYEIPDITLRKDAFEADQDYRQKIDDAETKAFDDASAGRISEEELNKITDKTQYDKENYEAETTLDKVVDAPELFGAGKVRAPSAEKFSTITDIQNARNRIVDAGSVRYQGKYIRRPIIRTICELRSNFKTMHPHHCCPK